MPSTAHSYQAVIDAQAAQPGTGRRTAACSHASQQAAQASKSGSGCLTSGPACCCVPGGLWHPPPFSPPLLPAAAPAAARSVHTWGGLPPPPTHHHSSKGSGCTAAAEQGPAPPREGHTGSRRVVIPQMSRDRNLSNIGSGTLIVHGTSHERRGASSDTAELAAQLHAALCVAVLCPQTQSAKRAVLAACHN